MIRPLCLDCRHLGKDFKCDAFPDGIPDAILLNEIDHRKPAEGDHGIVFEPVEKLKFPLRKVK